MKILISKNYCRILTMSFLLLNMFYNNLNAGNGFNYFTNAINISHTNTGTWHTIDVSSYIPAGSSGVILHLANESEDGADFAVRKNDSSTISLSNSIISAGTNIYAFCGVNSDFTFESYIENANCKIFLIGYSDEDVHYFGEEKDISLTTSQAWTEIDVSDQDVPLNATGVIVRVNGGRANNTAGIRSIGSTDDRTSSGSVVYQHGNYTYLFCGINDQRKFEAKVENTSIAINLVGYTLPPVNFFMNAIDISITNTETWTDIDLDTLLPPAANGIIYEINNTNNSMHGGKLREKGSQNDSANIILRNRAFTQSACGLDANQTVEGYRDLSGVEFYLIGFSQVNDPTPPGEIPAVRDGVNTDIDEQYSTVLLKANWGPSTDNESGIGTYYCSAGTSQGGIDILGWTDVGIDTFATLSGLVMSVGSTYYINVKAANTQGLESNVTSSDGIVIITDPSIPGSVGQVRDGLIYGLDADSTYSLVELSAHWNSAIDEQSGLSHYMYSIGTSQGGQEILNWISNGSDTSVMVISDTNISVGTTYYFNVKAVNTQAMESDVISSDGVEIITDPTPPLTITEVRDGVYTDSDTAYLTTELRANWGPSNDPESEIKKYFYAIGTSPGGTDIADWTDNGKDTIVIYTGLSLTPGSKYYFSVIPENYAGTQATATNSDGIYIKSLKPDERVASSGSSEDIQSAVNEIIAIGGGTVYIPEGDFTFTGTVVMPGGVSIIGAGIHKTILRSSLPTFFDINHFGENGGAFRISGISFYGHNPDDPANPVQLGISVHNIQNFRIDHCYFRSFKFVIGIQSLYDRPDLPQSHGVIDNCTFIKGVECLYQSMYGITDLRVWVEDMKMGTHEATFVEDCYFEGLSHPTDAFGGGHYVLRHSEVVDNVSVSGHGPGFDDSQRGTRCREIYENKIQKTDKVSWDFRWVGMTCRAGGGVVYNNSFVYCRNAMLLTIDASFNNYVDDDHDGIPDYPALDQVQEMWIWNNELDSTPQLILHYGDWATLLILEDRDYFLRAPTVELDGFTYTPYTYPHPLRSHPDFSDGGKDQIIKQERNLNVYPNPVDEYLTIEISNMKKDATIKLITLNGQTVYEKTINQNTNYISINVSGYHAGLYILKLESPELNQTEKIIIQ